MLIGLSFIMLTASGKTVDVMELMIFKQHKPSHITAYTYPELPSSIALQKAITPSIEMIETGAHAKLFSRLQERGKFEPLWSGVWEQDQAPELHEIKASPLKLWLKTNHTSPRTLSFYLIENDHVLSYITHPLQYSKPLYIDHPDYGMVLVMTKKHVEEDESTLLTNTENEDSSEITSD